MTKTKIIIAGIGGVGGYFGGLLANHFSDNENVEISFYARGRHLKEIQHNGLKVIKGKSEFIARPTLATDIPSEIGIADFIIVCTKSYDLETVIEQLQPCVNKDTIILPLPNGVDSKERITNILPNNIILDGCAYIVSRLRQFGEVENSGNIQTLSFGLDIYESERLSQLERIFKEADIEATLSKNISEIIWEKFIFISPTAKATSYFDKCIGEVLADNESFKTLTNLIEEIELLAKAKQITVSEDIKIKTVNKLRALPYETTSSMHSDFKAIKQIPRCNL